MNSIYGVYDQVAEIIAQLEPEKVLALKASPELQKRYEFLAEKLKSNSLSTEEEDELNHFIFLERLIRLAKMRAEK